MLQKPPPWEWDVAVHTTAPAPPGTPVTPPTGTTLPNSGPFGPPRNTNVYQHALHVFTTRLDTEYQLKAGNIAQAIEADLAAARLEESTHPLPPVAAILRELGVRSRVIQRKTAELQRQTVLSHGFFGSDPTHITVSQFLARAQALDKHLAPDGPALTLWRQSYRAAFEARLLAQTVAVLHQQQVNVHNWLVAVQASDQAQAAAAEAARQAAEHARIVAEQQRQQALAETARKQREQEEQRVREEQRLAAQAQAQRAAVEQARLAAEAAARHLAAEQSRLEQLAQAAREAEQIQNQQRAESALLEEQRKARQRARRKKKREHRRAARAEARYLADQARVQAQEQAKSVTPLQSPGMANSGSMAAFGPQFAGTQGTVSTSRATALALRSALRTAVSITATAVTVSAAPVLVGFAALLLPASLGNGDLYCASVPLSELAPDLTADLYELAASGGEVDLPLRLAARTSGKQTEMAVVSTDGVTVPANVPVRLARFDATRNVYVSGSVDAKGGPTLTWTPLVEPLDSSTDLPYHDTNLPVYKGATITAHSGRLDPFPQLDLYGLGGFITVFPIESGIPATFTMFRDRRLDPGVVSGNGQTVAGSWLGAASTPEGAPIPAQIADTLRGREFSSFRAFRRAFWKAVASDERLSGEFKRLNRIDMRDGLSPSTDPAEHAGKRKKMEIHHANPVSEGGAVYDVDNLRLMTPKQHIRAHSKNGEL
ncbi:MULTISPECIES: S-type pyocin domain-containing protein [Pseudomonas]|uniref:S-type pyocin domain-containing protein n=1 Tax=Pseudomonas TaxID=286 RepID=UPI001F4726B3|nr:S-type pyocin domain-containing protein [Pseudomonas sputi]